MNEEENKLSNKETIQQIIKEYLLENLRIDFTITEGQFSPKNIKFEIKLDNEIIQEISSEI